MYRKNRMWRDLVIRFGKKPLILTLALVITISGAVSGSLAWLTAATDVLTNTFTIGNIKIDLTETPDGDDDDQNNSYEMTLGQPIDKDPKVTVYENSKDCWLYIKIQVSDNFDDFLTYEIAEGWTKLSGEEGVYYREVDESKSAQSFYVLKDNKVHVKSGEDITNEMLDEISASNNYPYMKLKAFAVQRDKSIDKIDNAVDAWALIPAEEKVLVSTSASSAAATPAAVVPAAAEESTTAKTVLSNTPQSYAERKAQQAEEGWLAFAAS